MKASVGLIHNGSTKTLDRKKRIATQQTFQAKWGVTQRRRGHMKSRTERRFYG
jgi:hypothetical protein